jgi:septal ring factor EnvC (AmiA/AmiB activator)
VETRLGQVESGLNDLKQRLTSVERHMAALLATVPVVNERIDRLEARVAALETRTP